MTKQGDCIRGQAEELLKAEEHPGRFNQDTLWLSHATRFTFGGTDPRNQREVTDYPVDIEACYQRDGSRLWAVRRLGRCLNRAGEWEFEPMPSSRDEAFLARCRFQGREDALRALINAEED